MNRDKAVVTVETSPNETHAPSSGSAWHKAEESQQAARKPGILRRIWNGWLKVARVIGTIQMMIILSVVYWTVLMVTALLFKLFSDPLAKRGPKRGGWVKRDFTPHNLDDLSDQG